MRLLPHRPLPLPVIVVPLTVRIEPERPFAEWLRERLARERERLAEGGRT